MELSVSKHMVLTFLGSQGATQGPKHRKSKFSVPPTPSTSLRSAGPFPKGAYLASIAARSISVNLALFAKPRRQGYVTQVTQPRLHSRGSAANVTLPRLRCPGYIVKATQSRLQKRGDIIKDPKNPTVWGLTLES